MLDALLVPMNLNVLRLPQNMDAAGPLLDFEELPWSSATWGRDVNADTPFMASAIVSPPLGGLQRVLSAGFHLHWTLPNALCRGQVDPKTGKTVFPAVPNRWLVTRVLDGVFTRWVVESDYIWPKLAAWPETDQFPRYRRGLAVTLLAHDLSKNEQPFQHVGRAYAWNDWKETSTASRMAGPAGGSGKLTAVGYGDVTFAAYHPHCHSVFGFSDSWEDNKSVPTTIEYRVIGWYSDTKADPLTAGDLAWDTDGATNPTWKLTSHRWQVTGARVPKRTMCFGSTKVVADQATSTAPVVVSVANSGTEAMSVYLAAQLSSDLALREKIEDQLEALQMRKQLAARDVDLAARLRSARHERGFRPESGPQQWQLTVVDEKKLPSDTALISLEASLRALNALEAELNVRTIERDAAQQALYADWCKYMSIAYRPPDEDPHQYPEIDDVKSYIERVYLGSDKLVWKSVIEEKAAEISALTKSIDVAVTAMNKVLENHRLGLVAPGKVATTTDPPAPLKLEEVPGPRFWRPNDPVVLMTGGGIQKTRTVEQNPDAYLICKAQAFENDPWTLAKPDFSAALDRLAVPAVVGPGFSISNGLPWNPLFLEWGIDLYPAEGHSLGRSTGQGNYQPEVIVENYDLPSRGADLAPRPGLDVVSNPDRFDGRCFFSSHASDVVFDRLCALLTEELLENYGPLTDDRNSDAFRTALGTWYGKAPGLAFYPADASQPTGYRFEPTQYAALKTWYLTRPLAPNGVQTLASRSETARFDDPLWTAMCALSALYDASGKRRPFLSASLDGFHDELLGFTKYPVLPIDEPIGFPTYRKFSQDIGKLTGRQVATPEPQNPYSPIRSGELQVSALRIIDSFGRSNDIRPTRILGPIRNTFDGRPNVLYLPPRVAQAMNVKFRWLDADLRQADFIEIPGNEVICGWLVPNPNSHSITVFSRSGASLGLLTIDRDQNYVEWVPAPGQPAFEKVVTTSRERDVLQMDASIDNDHLRKVVDHIWSAPTAYLKGLVDSLADAQENIDPDAGSQYSSVAMLMGRPLVVARAELDIYLLHKAPARGDWLDFERRIHEQRQDSSDEGFTDVHFPIRLGDYGRHDDGVAGYWIEDATDGSFVDKCFYAQAADDVASLGTGRFDGNYQIEAHKKTAPDGSALQYFEGKTINIRQSIAAAPLAVTMLFDPRGRVHLTTGILPTKVINIPPAFFTDALNSIDLWVKVGPMLARQGKHDLPLPTDPDYDLVWRESAWSKTAEGADDVLTWDDLRATPTIRGDEVLAAIKALKIATDIATLVTKGWLEKAGENGNRYRIIPKDKRTTLGLGDTIETAFADFLDQHATRIGEFLTGARFDDRSEAREGWLVFQHLSEPSTTAGRTP